MYIYSDSSDDSDDSSESEIDDAGDDIKDDESKGEGGDKLNEFEGVKLSSLNWKKLKFEGDINTCKIKKLSHGYSYLIRIRCKNDSGWSTFCEPIKISPKSLALQWDKKKHGKGITFLSENRVKFSSRQAKIAVDYKIKLKKHKIFTVEYQVHRVSSYTWLGFIRSPAKTYVNDWSTFLGSNNINEFSIGFSRGSMNITVCNAYGNNYNNYNKQTNIPIRKKIKNNDRFKFKFNMKSSNVNVYHNNKSVGQIFTNIPDSIVCAVSNNSSHTDVSIRYIP